MRYRRTTNVLLMTLLFVASILTLWRAFPVVGVRVRGTHLIFRLADDSGPQLLSDDPHLLEQLNHPEVFLPHQYVNVSALTMAVLFIVVIGLSVGSVWIWRRWQRTVGCQTESRR